MFNQKRSACRELMRQLKLSASHYTPRDANNLFPWMKIALSGWLKYHPCKLKTNLQFHRVASSHIAFLSKHLCPWYYLLDEGERAGAKVLFKYIKSGHEYFIEIVGKYFAKAAVQTASSSLHNQAKTYYLSCLLLQPSSTISITLANIISGDRWAEPS